MFRRDFLKACLGSIASLSGIDALADQIVKAKSPWPVAYGPTRIFTISATGQPATSDTRPSLIKVLANDNTLMQWYMSPNANFMWFAAPGHDIMIPRGNVLSATASEPALIMFRSKDRLYLPGGMEVKLGMG